MKTCDIIIVNWNSGPQLHSCINSIVEFGLPLVNQIIVVDNGSTDGSEIDVENLPKVTLIRAGYNRGFAAACNQGADLASADYLLFLNPDTRLFENSLSIPLDFMNDEDNTKAGICGIQLVDESGEVSHSCARFPSLSIFLAQALGLNRLPKLRHLTQAIVEWSHDSTRNVEQVMGSFFLMRRSVFEILGGFDERFFVYFEEVDLSLRACQAGWRSVYLANAQAFHAGGGTSRQVKAHRLFYSLRSRLLYGFKRFSLIKAWFLLLVTLGLEPLTRIIFALVKGELQSVQHTLKGYYLLFMDLPAILRVALK